MTSLLWFVIRTRKNPRLREIAYPEEAQQGMVLLPTFAFFFTAFFEARVWQEWLAAVFRFNQYFQPLTNLFVSSSPVEDASQPKQAGLPGSTVHCKFN
jgi:hypothetical protein